MRKFFTFFLALATSVGMSWASVTWISGQYGNEKGYNAGTPFTKDGVTVTMSDNAFFNVSYWGDASLQCIKGTFDPTAGNYVFSNSLGENFVKIVIAAGYPSDWESFPKGDGWVLSGDEYNGYILTWTGNASTVTLMDNELHSVHQSIEGDIVFYFEEDLQEPYTFYFHPGSWAGTYAKYAVQSWSTDYEAAVYSEFMTPVDGHDGWFSTSVPDGNNNMNVCAYPSEATTPTEGAVDWSSQLSESDTYTYYYNNVGYMEDFDCKLVGADRILSGNIIYSVNDEEHTAEVYGDQSPVAPSGELTIPSSFTWKTTTYTVTSIAGSAYWYGSGITSVSLPNTLLHIGNAAFIGTGLTSVTIPSSVTSIEDGAFALCGNLSSVTLEEGLTALATQMFQGDPSLTQISFPNSIADLPAGILSSCENLVSVTLGTGVDTIGENAFSNSDKLARLTIYAANPPAVNDSNHPALVTTCSLMVPSSVKAAYQAHPYWSKFEIKGIYIVTFKDKDGNTIKAEAVEEGQSATAPDAPEVGCYTFTGWSADFSDVHSDLEVNALYTQNVYTVTFLNEGVQHNQQHVFCGDDAAAPADPTKEGHHFTGWDAEFTNVQSNLTIHATFEINTYTVTFKDSEGNTIGDPQIIEWNKAAEAPKAPEVECNHFTGWDKAFDHVTENLVVTAQYAINQYTVTFLNEGSPVEVQNVNCGDDATKPADPTKEGHHFTGWDAEFTNVQSNLTINATFEINTYTVTFKDIDDQIIGEPQVVAWNTAAEAPEAPKVECYTFTGWDKAFTNVKEDLVVNALYSLNTYTVIFNDNDGSELKKQTVACGDDAVAPEAPHHTGYTFIGWDKAFTNVKEDLVVTATFERGEDAAITVEFYDFDNDKIASSNVVIRIPAADDIEGFYFVGWRPVAENILDNATIKIEAMYIPVDPTSAPDVYTNPANPAQKLVRDGNVYILKDGHEYTITGLKVK